MWSSSSTVCVSPVYPNLSNHIPHQKNGGFNYTPKPGQAFEEGTSYPPGRFQLPTW